MLDGHHRFRACTELGIEPDFEVRKFDDKLLEKKFVIEANLRRRHLNNFQLVELAVPLLEIEKALAKKRQVKGGKNGRNLQLGLAPEDAEPMPEFKAKAAEVVAQKAGVSARTFERGKKIIENSQRRRQTEATRRQDQHRQSLPRNSLKPKTNPSSPSDPMQSSRLPVTSRTGRICRRSWSGYISKKCSVPNVATPCSSAVNATRPCRNSCGQKSPKRVIARKLG